MLESKIQQKILQYCKQENIVALKVDSSSRRGLPDLTVITPKGHVLFVEVKTQTGKLTPLQKRMHTILEKQNANVFTIRSLDDFKSIIKEFT